MKRMRRIERIRKSKQETILLDCYTFGHPRMFGNVDAFLSVLDANPTMETLMATMITTIMETEAKLEVMVVLLAVARMTMTMIIMMILIE